MMKTFSVRVSGKVQGVFFRASARERAQSLGITGFVRNEPDGSVYIEAQGEEDALDEFLQWCHRGPANASVQKCEAVEIEHRDSFHGFEISRGY